MDYSFSRDSDEFEGATPLGPLQWAQLLAQLAAAHQKEVPNVAAPNTATPLDQKEAGLPAGSFHAPTAALLRNGKE